MLTVALQLYLALHAVFCLILFLGIRIGFLKCEASLFPMAVLIPGTGVLIVLLADFFSRKKLAGSRRFELEELHLEGDVRLQTVESETTQEYVLPLEEAMSVNDVGIRRKLMQDILRQNPGAYVSLLQEARLDDDIEVTHYASTAIMELQRSFDLSLQKSEQAYLDHPNQPEALQNYLQALERYIGSGLIDENILFIYRTRFAEAMQKKLKRDPENMMLYVKAIDNWLGLGNINEALQLANQAVVRWPNREEAWFALLKVCCQSNDGPGIRRIITEIKQQNIYLTPEGRSILQFWDGQKPQE